jgi:Ser/Thr protein kinase RdoA (MazF antagonist)
MGDTSFIAIIEKLAQSVNLGEVILPPKSISGGLLHKLYMVKTTKGKYAVKMLNPLIMQRPNVLRNIINSEKIANKLSETIPALPALQTDNDPVLCIDGQYFMVFKWVNGVSLLQNEINVEHCRIIGRMLASIHITDLSELNIKQDKFSKGKQINWDFYLSEGRRKGTPWVEAFERNIDALYEWNIKSIESDIVLHKDMVLSHRDMDSKNVLWNNGKPVLIDWEAAGYVNPTKELVEVLMYWSVTGNNKVNKEKFKALLSGYKEEKNIGSVD